MTRWFASLLALAALAGCGDGGNDVVSARDAETQKAVEDKIKQTINLHALGNGTSIRFLGVQCIPESDTKLSCIVNGSVEGQTVGATWEAIIDPDTGKFNVYSTG